MQDFLARNFKLWAVLALGILLAVVGFAASWWGSSQPSRDELAIRQNCQDAINAQRMLPVPPASYKGGAISDSLLQQMEGRVSPTLARYYTGDALANVTTTLNKALRTEQQNSRTVRYLGGGVVSMTFSHVSIKGNTATVVAQGVLWAKFSQITKGKTVTSTPRNRVDFNFTLVKINGHWLISEETSKVLPGGAG